MARVQAKNPLIPAVQISRASSVFDGSAGNDTEFVAVSEFFSRLT
jgi:hypothetical protein